LEFKFDDIVRTLDGVCALLAGDRRVMGAFSKLHAVLWEVGVAGWLVT